MSAIASFAPSQAPLTSLACPKCKGMQFKLVCPVAWPIQSVAATCWVCGTVAGYYDAIFYDDRVIKKFQREKPQREYVVSHRIARRVYSRNEQRLAVIQGLRNKIEPAQIAEDLNMPEQVVHAIGVNEGFLRSASTAEQIRDRYLQGYNPEEIAKALRIHQKYVTLTLRRMKN